jgi:predicted ATPase
MLARAAGGSPEDRGDRRGTTSPAMITRIEVDGFKSLRGFAVDLEPFTVLIGPNSAGKSNVLDALALLSRLASQPIAEAFKHGRGKSIDQFSRHGAEVAGAIRFAVELLEYGYYPAKDAFQSRFRYELTIERHAVRAGAERLVARDERLRAMRREDDAWIAAHPEFAAYAGYADANEDYFITLKDKHAKEQRVIGLPSHWPEELSIPPTHTALASRIVYAAAHLIKRNLEQCRMLDPGARHLGEPSERIDSGELGPDATNLPTVLAELPPNVLGEIRADLVSLVPGIASFEVTPAGDEIHLDFELSGGERMPARLVSAGTLHILVLLTALRMEPRPYLLCIEEPENGIYPGRLRALLDVLQEATTRGHEDEAREKLEESRRELGGEPAYIHTNQLPTQILLTTHSPVALAALRSRPQHLRFVDMVRRNGERVTRVRTVGKPIAGEHGRLTISPREIDALMQAVESEEPG